MIGKISQRKYSKLKCKAKEREIKFNVSLEFLNSIWQEQKGRCVYTNLQLTLPKPGKQYGGTASLDRINSKRGYVKGNVQWVHNKVNMMKWKMEADEFINLCIRIAKNNKKKGKNNV